MKTIAFAIIALALTGGVASAQYYTNGPVFLYQPQPDTTVSSAILQQQLADTASGAALQRNQMNELRMQLMRQQLQQQQR
jgi:hypothetical protein